MTTREALRQVTARWSIGVARVVFLSLMLWGAQAAGQCCVADPTDDISSTPGNRFGFSVAIDQQTGAARAIVGLPGFPEAVVREGAVRFYVRGADWQPVGFEVQPEDVQVQDKFGTSVAMDGVLSVCGAPFEDESALNAGAAYVFLLDAQVSAQWQEEFKLTTNVQPAASDHFGSAVGISGDVVVVGAPFGDGPFLDSGRAYVFRRDLEDPANPIWLEEQFLDALDGATGDEFGRAIAIDEDVVVVGAPSHSGCGAAYVFRYNASSSAWEFDDALAPPGLDQGDDFGFAVTVSGETILVGAPGDDDAASDGGALYAFRLENGVWVQDGPKLLPCEISDDANLGWSVALAESAGTALGGAPADTTEGGVGRAHLFVRTGSMWGIDRVLRNDTQDILLGHSVSMDKDTDEPIHLVSEPKLTIDGQPQVFEFIPCAADANLDQVVDVDDLVAVVLDWDTDGSTNGGDVTCDGLVDVDDLVAVVLGWGPCPHSNMPTPLELCEEFINAGLTQADCDDFQNHLNDDNYRCWLGHYLSGECCPMCPTCPPTCPGPDPFGRH